jgi:thiol-disulfide isomerase/thioredoxin
MMAPRPASTGKSRWINVWATWCKPCIEELPRLAKWQAELGKKADFELVFLSADGDPAAVAEFAKAHPEVAGSLELAAADALQPWATGIGVPGQAVLPIHVFVDGKDRVRCVRTAGIGEGDRDAVEQLLMAL